MDSPGKVCHSDRMAGQRIGLIAYSWSVKPMAHILSVVVCSLDFDWKYSLCHPWPFI